MINPPEVTQTAEGAEFSVKHVAWHGDGSLHVTLADLIEDCKAHESAFIIGLPECVSVDSWAPDPLQNDDPVVRRIVQALNVLEWLVLYELLALIPSWRSSKLAYIYVAGWLTVLAAILFWPGSLEAWWKIALVVALPAYRMFDLLRWYADLMLDRAHHYLMSTERNLVFVGLNLAETVLIGAIWLEATGSASSSLGAMFDALGLVSQLGSPAVSEGVRLSVCQGSRSPKWILNESRAALQW